MAKVTLDHLREKAQNKFEDLFVEEAEVVFQHVMRLAKADRKKILDLVDRVEKLQDEDSKDTSSGDAVDQLESLYRDVLKAVADDKKKAEALLKQLNLPELVVLFESWTEGTQLGNVSSSES
jgi:DNA phosphorothioation-dependent restriction protein DptG